MVASEARDRVETRRDHPDRMVLLDCRADSPTQPLVGRSKGFGGVLGELIIDLESHVGEERWLSTAEVLVKNTLVWFKDKRITTHVASRTV